MTSSTVFGPPAAESAALPPSPFSSLGAKHAGGKHHKLQENVEAEAGRPNADLHPRTPARLLCKKRSSACFPGERTAKSVAMMKRSSSASPSSSLLKLAAWSVTVRAGTAVRLSRISGEAAAFYPR
ncbi:hypothetical protein cyc_01832 [Cyclospora cayetanensis]|uniref:Uncharacterized protein n=1 Tax=Cyclospora cayetanensis TaxID=88456 RepID=A0A1D3CV83_9EIME|nr:hypothetical protein cyc_01832 [Cyclospora cayetanensis]